MEIEKGGVAYEDIGEAGCRDARYQNGQQRGHAQVDHEHLEREDQSCYRRLEDAGNGSGSPAAHQQHQVFLLQVEQLAEIAADGRSGKYYRCLGSYGTSESDGDGRRDDRRPAVVPFQMAVFRGNGVEHPGDAMRYVVLHHIFYEHRGNPDADDGEQEVEPVVAGDGESRREQYLYLPDNPMQEKGGDGGKEADEEREYERHLAIRYVLIPPIDDPLHRGFFLFYRCFHVMTIPL